MIIISTSIVKRTSENSRMNPSQLDCVAQVLFCPNVFSFNLWPKLVQPFCPDLCLKTQLNKPCSRVPEIDVHKHETNEKASQIPDLCPLESAQVITHLKFVQNVKNLPFINHHTLQIEVHNWGVSICSILLVVLLFFCQLFFEVMEKTATAAIKSKSN